MSVETSTAPEIASEPAGATEAGSGLRERPRRRRAWLQVPTIPFPMIFTVLTVLFLAVATVGIGWGMYQSQAGDVTALEARAQARTTAAAAADQPVDEATKAFLADKVFSSLLWTARLDASRGVFRAVHDSDEAFAAKVAGSVWWPGLPGRVRAAGAALGPFDASGGDRLELVTATADARRVCMASDPEGFIAGLKAPGADVSVYERAAAAVLPDLLRAGRAHFCPPGSQVTSDLPFSKEPTGK